MPSTPVKRQKRVLYQPRLPLAGAATAATPRTGRRAGVDGTSSVASRSPGGARVTAPLPSRAPTPGGGPGWRLDEKTRRAGRQGVAAARAALAGTARAEDDRQETAA